MVKANEPLAMKSLVDMDTGKIGREIFVDQDIYQQELERGLRAHLALYRP